jgi:hypothetical protein
MPEERETASTSSASITEGISRSLDRRLGEHLQVLRAEVKQALGHLERGAVSLAGGVGLTALGGVMGALMFSNRALSSSNASSDQNAK